MTIIQSLNDDDDDDDAMNNINRNSVRVSRGSSSNNNNNIIIDKSKLNDFITSSKESDKRSYYESDNKDLLGRLMNS